MNSFSQALDSGRFVVTVELNPPKGVDIEAVVRKAEALKELVEISKNDIVEKRWEKLAEIF